MSSRNRLIGFVIAIVALVAFCMPAYAADGMLAQLQKGAQVQKGSPPPAQGAKGTPPAPTPKGAPAKKDPARKKEKKVDKEWEKILKAYDKDGDGKLSPEEMKAWRADAKNEGLKGFDREWVRLLKAYDKDADGKLSADETKNWRTDTINQRSNPEKASGAVKMKFDKNNNKKIDGAEVAAFKEAKAKALATWTKLSEEMFTKFAKNGKLDKQGFKAGLKWMRKDLKKVTKLELKKQKLGKGVSMAAMKSPTGKSLWERKWAEMLTAYDKNKDGKLTADEAKAWRDGMMRDEMDPAKVNPAIVKRFDKNGDGKLVGPELEAFKQAQAKFLETRIKLNEEMFNKFAKNGVLDQQGFKAGWKWMEKTERKKKVAKKLEALKTAAKDKKAKKAVQMMKNSGVKTQPAKK